MEHSYAVSTHGGWQGYSYLLEQAAGYSTWTKHASRGCKKGGKAEAVGLGQGHGTGGEAENLIRFSYIGSGSTGSLSMSCNWSHWCNP